MSASPFANVSLTPGPLLSRPAASAATSPSCWYATDTGQLFVVVTDATNVRTWVEIGRVPVDGQNLDLYVDPTTGDDANPGTQALPLRTIDAAVVRAGDVGWTGYGHVNLAAGVYNLATNAILSPPGGFGVGAEPLCFIGALEDSGLGTRTVGASTAGSGSTFATTTDTAGGLVVNAWRGWILRYTSGTQIGKQYLISGNTVGGQWNLVGLQTAPANGTTFVVERPASVVRSGNGIVSVTGAATPMVGFYRVRFDGQSVANSSIVVRGLQLHHSECWFENLAQVGLNFQGGLVTMFAPVTNNGRVVFPSLGQLTTVGSYFTTGVANATVNLQRASVLDYQNSLVAGYNTSLSNAGYVQAALSYFTGVASVRGANGSQIQIAQCRFDTVTSVAGDYATATIVADGGSSALLQLVDVSTSTALALSVAGGSVCKCISLTGSGNVGASAVSVLRKAELIKCSGNTVTATTPGNDVQIGARAATSAWAAVNAGPIYDDAAVGTNQFCLTSN